MNIGINFFGPRRKLYHDFEGTLDILKSHGINSAEICVAFAPDGGDPPKEMKLNIPEEVLRESTGGIWPPDKAAERLKTVRDHGFTVLSCHMMLGQTSAEALRKHLPDMLKFGTENDIRYFVFNPMRNMEGIRPMIPAIREVSDALAEVGITLLLHNHEVECMPEEGTTVLDYVLEQCPNLGLELDVGWAKFAGANPVALMGKYAARIPLLHFKDVTADACAETRNSCFTAVGEGSIPLREIMAAAPNCAIIEHGLIIDQDDSPTDILVDIGRGAENIRSAAG